MSLAIPTKAAPDVKSLKKKSVISHNHIPKVGSRLVCQLPHCISITRFGSRVDKRMNNSKLKGVEVSKNLSLISVENCVDKSYLIVEELTTLIASYQCHHK